MYKLKEQPQSTLQTRCVSHPTMWLQAAVRSLHLKNKQSVPHDIGQYLHHSVPSDSEQSGTGALQLRNA